MERMLWNSGGDAGWGREESMLGAGCDPVSEGQGWSGAEAAVF